MKVILATAKNSRDRVLREVADIFRDEFSNTLSKFSPPQGSKRTNVVHWVNITITTANGSETLSVGIQLDGTLHLKDIALPIDLRGSGRLYKRP